MEIPKTLAMAMRVCPLVCVLMAPSEAPAAISPDHPELLQQGILAAYAAGQNPSTGNAQDARNALFNVNGIDIESASNTVSDAIPGDP